RLVGSGQSIIASPQPRIDHIAGDVSHTGPALSIDIGDRRAGVAGKLDEARRSEARMAYLDDMVELAPIEIAGQQIEEPSEVLRVKAFERRKLPEHRSELVVEFGQARREEALDGVACLGQDLLLGHEPRPFHREDETDGCSRGPALEVLRALAAGTWGVGASAMGIGLGCGACPSP